MRTSDDAIRSVKRHVAAQLGPDWEVRLASKVGQVSYPHALVSVVGPASSSVNGLIVQTMQPMTVYCYPEPQETFELGLVAAASLMDEMWDAFVGSATPYRVPLYDYDGVDLDHGSDTRNAHDYLRVHDVQVHRVPDVSDERRVIVVCDFRASWMRSTARLSALRGGPVLQSVRQRLIAEGAQKVVAPTGLKSEVTFGRPSVSKA